MIFFYLSKILDFIFSPFFWSFLLLVMAWLKWEKNGKAYLSSALLILYVFSNGYLLNLVMNKWEITPRNLEEKEKYQTAIVLGGMAAYDYNTQRIVFRSGSDRIFQAYDLYNKKKISKILFSGGSGQIASPNNKEALFIEAYFKSNGIKSNDFLLESESRNTYENAIYTSELIKKKKIKGPFLLITSAFHMKRALACFEKQNIPVIPYPVDPYAQEIKVSFPSIILPSIDALKGWQHLLHEMSGYRVYKVLNYL